MFKKYFVWNIDDGLEQDKRIISVLKKYGMGATFNLNSGLYGDKTYEGRIGNLGMREVPYSEFDLTKRHLLPYVEHFRIPEEEVKDVYEGFEIASHSLEHKNLKKCDDRELNRQIAADVENLSKKFDQKIVGFAYPYGVSDQRCVKIMKENGIEYARTIGSAKDFSFPEDPYRMPMTCWHVSKKAFEKIDRFIETKAEKEDLFFLIFAHGYEFDFGTKESNWEKFEDICKRISSHSDIVCCSTGEAFRLHKESL
ncbi:MAG: polysaccharide deacetylase family protein [Erysipelotrichaceae bacterium]|nr:polysaccharide deacetylase family protein [Erysipelotrichaceae bacterium]